MTNLMKLSCEEFLTQLSSKEPTPGGGAAAALVGATAASLCCMVANIFIDGKHTAKNLGTLSKVLHDAEFYRNELLRLMNEDARVYQLVANAHKMPKDNSMREKAIHENYEQAVWVAGNIATCCYNVLQLSRELQTYALGSLGLDADCAETMAISGFESASGLVYGNLSYTGNDALNEVLINKMKRMEAQV